VDVQGKIIELPVEEKSLCFTYCQVPVIYKLADKNGLELVLNDSVSKSESLSLDRPTSQKIFDRTGDVVRIVVHVNQAMLR
jgi:hypothetical protein